MNKIEPKIRFVGFKEKWVQRKFSDIVNRISNQSDDITLPKVEFEDIISGEGRLNKDVSQKMDSRKGTIFEPNFILFGKLRPYLKNWLFPNFKGIALGDFWVFEAINSSPLFNFYLIQSDKYQSVANLSTGTKMPRSDWTIVSNTEFEIPNDISEQQKIGEFFKRIDDLITLQQKIIEQQEQYKIAMLQKMFPQKNESTVQIKFKGFSGNWEERLFLDNIESIIDFRGKTPKKLGMEWSTSGYVALSALNVKNGYIDFGTESHYGDEALYKKWMGDKELKKGQVVFTTEAPMGNVAQIPDNNGYILSQRTIAFNVKKSMITNDFLAVLLRTPQVYNDLTSLSSGGTAKGVSQKSLTGLKVKVPITIEEQQKISMFFKEIDDTIALHQKKLVNYKELKKSLLKKMFI